MLIKNLKNGMYQVKLKGLPSFYVKSYDDALAIAFKLGGRV